jgi:methionyl-tRNA formyltransferase
MELGYEAVTETLALIENGLVQTTIQEDSSEIKTAYKLNKDNCKIDFTKSGFEIYNLIRGLSPYPSAWCTFLDGENEWSVKIYEAKLVVENHTNAIGCILTTKKEMKIAVQNGYLEITSLQFPGKKRMSTAELLNGMTLSAEAKAV